MRGARTLLLIVTVVSVAGASCGGGTDTPEDAANQVQETGCRPQGEAVSLIAHNTAYDPTCLAATAGKGLEVRFDNQDGGARHNFSLYSADPAAVPDATTLFRGRIVQGPAMVTYDVPALAAGTYHFHCDVHPDRMSGVFVVE